ncbi:hypothetical protein BYT27DRAFT_7024691, partial [Phlegmacium glaucopus]
HRTSECTKTNQNTLECSNCQAKNNGYAKGHGAADRRCPVFLERVERMNKMHQENAYKYFCTTDPDTW